MTFNARERLEAMTEDTIIRPADLRRTLHVCGDTVRRLKETK